jgi:GDP-L-fucose synthase
MELSSSIYVAGHNGMVGSAIVRELRSQGYENLIFRSSKELDLRNQNDVNQFFNTEKPQYVFLAAAKVGGILANNSYRGEFIYDNLMIEANIIHAAYLNKVKKLLFLGSSCIYPKLAPQPMNEDALLTGELEYTNEPYAIAKIAGIKLCESYRLQYGCDFISAMPTNLYGPGDNYDLSKSHVLPALLRKMHLGKCLEQDDWQAIYRDINVHPTNGLTTDSSREEILQYLESKGVVYNPSANKVEVQIWGSGQPLREFMHVDDLAHACVHLMHHYSDLRFVNVGSGEEISIKDLAYLIKDTVGFKGNLSFDSSKPDGTPRKLMDSSRLKNLGYTHRISLAEGIKSVYEQIAQN